MGLGIRPESLWWLRATRVTSDDVGAGMGEGGGGKGGGSEHRPGSRAAEVPMWSAHWRSHDLSG